jgi:hypothetical protein
MTALTKLPSLFEAGYRTAFQDLSGQDISGQDLSGLQCRTDVSFHELGQHCFLFDRAAQTLVRINRIGAFIWCLLAEGTPPRQIADEIANNSACGRTEAERCVLEAIGQWRTHGFVRTHVHPPDDQRLFCHVLGSVFEIRFSDTILKRSSESLLVHHALPSADAARAILTVERRGDGHIAIASDGETFQTLADADVLAPAVFASLMRLALMHSDDFPALHAGSVRSATGGVVLFPAPSGSGKSTLMAGLLAAGHEVLGDDTVVFQRATLKVRPLTPYICVKSGSWDTIAGYHADFLARPAFLRADNARVRYLVGENRDPMGQAEPVRSIVFPRFERDAPLSLKPLDGFAAFTELLKEIDPIGRELEPADIDRLIDWIEGIDRFQLVYGNLDDAMTALSDMLA